MSWQGQDERILIMLKKALCSLIALAGLYTAAYAYNYDTSLPLKGKSIANAKLQEDTLFTAYMFAHRIAKPDCQDFAIVDTAVSQEKVDNKWQEIWTIKACTRTVNIPINFQLTDDNAVYAVDPMGVKVTEN